VVAPARCKGQDKKLSREVAACSGKAAGATASARLLADPKGAAATILQCFQSNCQGNKKVLGVTSLS